MMKFCLIIKIQDLINKYICKETNGKSNRIVENNYQILTKLTK